MNTRRNPVTTLAAALVTAITLCGSPAASAQSQGVPGLGQLGGPSKAFNPTEMAQWLAGRAQFDRDFHQADGLGTPELNADSCRGCHEQGAMGGAGALELNVSRFAKINGGLGPYEDLPGGQAISKLRPPWEDGRENYHPDADVFEQRQTPAVFGLGLFDSISDATILANEDPLDLNGDGIKGIARIIMVNGQPEVGKFGWKAQIPKLADFVNDAMAGENGITTPDNGRGFALLSDSDRVPDPELTVQQTADLAFFISNLAEPKRVGSTDLVVARGEEIFSEIMCDRCHKPSMPGSFGPVKAYTDLLLHDVMPPDFVGMSEVGAEMGFYRTPPLWGIRHSPPYMHDGRAETLEQAILAHEREALASKTAFTLLPAGEQVSLIKFLEDL